MPKKGFKQTKEHIGKRGVKTGKNNPNWKGGIKSLDKQRYYNQKNKEWRARNKEKCKIGNARRKANRRARERSAEGSFTEGEWETLKIQYNWTCPRCKKREPEINLTVDHIIPLSKGGSNWIENIQPLCLDCNKRKATKIEKYEL